MLITVIIDRKTKKITRDKKYPKHINFPKEFIRNLSLTIEEKVEKTNEKISTK